MWGWLTDLFYRQGKRIEDRERAKSDYKPKYGGYWNEKGDDQWEWVEEEEPTSYWVNVLQVGKGYKIVVSNLSHEEALESVEVLDVSTLESLLDDLGDRYSILGKVEICTDIG
jgi:hypothetical protein